jgi:uncharacterized protein with NRDE domain
MCLIALALHAHPGWPLVLAGNRDEFHARPAGPLHQWPEAPDIIAGRDLGAGGTWLGLSHHGRLAAVTNVRRPSLAAARRSRGALPVDFLQGSGSPDTFVRDLRPHFDDYGLCNLLLIGDGEAVYASNQPGIAPQRLGPGIVGLSNAALDSPWPKTLALKTALQRELDGLEAGRAAVSESPFEGLFEALAEERIAADAALPDTGVGLDMERRLSPAFIRGPIYGTRCSTVVCLGRDGAGLIEERRFGPDGVTLGHTRLSFRWPPW